MTKKRNSPIHKIKENTTAVDLKRVIGSIEGNENGPTIIALAGMHGNEPSGVDALENVFDMLMAAQVRLKGRLIGIRSNLEALRANVRYVDEDMNRIWFPGIVDQIRNSEAEELESSERVEMKQIMNLIDDYIKDGNSESVVLADLHSFSAEGCMFAITAEKKKHVDLLSSLHIPLIFGIENTLRGTALRYYQDQGYMTFALEGGQHTNDLTIYNVTAALMMLLKNCGVIDADSIDKLKEFDRHLKEHTQNVPPKVELIYQHIIEEGDNFSMRSGFKNFQYVKKGEWLANDREGKIRAQCDGYIVMPLYQDQGNDGFFIVREKA